MGDERGGNLLKKKSFWVRTISGIIMTLILIGIFSIGYDVMLLFLGLISLVGMYELYRALKMERSIIALIGYLTVIAHYILIRFTDTKYIIVVYCLSLILMMAVMVFRFPKYGLYQVFGGYFAVFYIGVSFSLMYLLRVYPPSGAYLVWLIVLSSWGCDIFAYLFGMLFGKHPFVPNLSPKKSVEGAIGGLVGAVVLCLIYGFAVQRFIPTIRFAPFIFALIGLLGAAAAQVGDLAASAIKRKLKIKDYGNLIPGHGGILDRFDSMILVSPIIYLITFYSMLVHTVV